MRQPRKNYPRLAVKFPAGRHSSLLLGGFGLVGRAWIIQDSPRVFRICRRYLQLQGPKPRLHDARVLSRQKNLNPRRLQPQPCHFGLQRLIEFGNRNNVVCHFYVLPFLTLKANIDWMPKR